MKLSLVLSFALILTCSGCDRMPDKKNNQESEEALIYDLNESTDIIIQLIKTNDLEKVLSDAGQEEINMLVKNFSPAEMTLEAEALNYEGISALIFYKDTIADLKPLLEKLARQFSDVKFITIDAHKLFKITESVAQVEEFPALILLQNRAEIERIEPIILTTFLDDASKLFHSADRRNQQ